MRRLVSHYTGSICQTALFYLEGASWFGFTLVPYVIRPFSIWKAMRGLVQVYAGPIYQTVVFYLESDAQAGLGLRWSHNGRILLVEMNGRLRMFSFVFRDRSMDQHTFRQSCATPFKKKTAL